LMKAPSLLQELILANATFLELRARRTFVVGGLHVRVRLSQLIVRDQAQTC
jgi:hypothetical protein